MVLGGNFMPKLIIKGRKAYIDRMYKHLRKEHPSTKRRMKKRA
jgi:hypothetical protein